MNLREWPIGGAVVAFVLSCGIISACIWQYLPHATAEAAGPIPALPTAAEIGFDKNRAFSEFHAQMLGLPTVWTYPTKARR